MAWMDTHNAYTAVSVLPTHKEDNSVGGVQAWLLFSHGSAVIIATVLLLSHGSAVITAAAHASLLLSCG